MRVFETHVQELKNDVRKILKNMDVQLSMHDFRVVEGTTHTNLIFDIVVPFKYKMSSKLIQRVRITSYTGSGS